MNFLLVDLMSDVLAMQLPESVGHGMAATGSRRRQVNVAASAAVQTSKEMMMMLLPCSWSKNNSSKESQVGVMWRDLCERVISHACAAFQPRM